MGGKIARHSGRTNLSNSPQDGAPTEVRQHGAFRLRLIKRMRFVPFETERAMRTVVCCSHWFNNYDVKINRLEME